jgi:hypothetical protein
MRLRHTDTINGNGYQKGVSFMVDAVDHDPVSGAATVTGEAAKGALGGIAIAALAGAAGALLIGGLLTLISPVAITVGWITVPILAAIGTGLAWGVTGGTLGGLFGAAEGVVKVNKQQHAFDAQMREHQANIQMAQAMAQPQALPQAQPAVAPQPDPQEIYNQGVQAGAQQVISHLQDVHSQMIAEEQKAQAAQPAPVAAEPQVVHHVVHTAPNDEHFEAVHASGEIKGADGEAKGHFTAMVADKKGSLDLKKIIAAKEAANDPNFSQQRLA